MAQATLGGGCFWCIESAFLQVKGIEKVQSGYTGGDTENPTYKLVCTGTTGHAEVAQLTYNPEVISYRQILEIFFTLHDPTQLNRQGNDVGTQYRSSIFYHDDEQKHEAEQVIKELEEDDAFADPIVTEVSTLETFWAAEDYHENYFNRNPENPYCQAVISPKLAKFRKTFSSLLK
ncbi:peptide-methionine (S)-S-oxide reductase MsrA [Idiomarina seosinensis]|uniref:Peptide methionine sulfoxide reductase MsrA n=1 Tax=Idiomarina seosinensis TaxID=281739 RepID=A0A432ZD17_9GAMM|nr:peptide-methionine (S)-S-oxide reductase MsrA [Idiomarina seosinensis]RUO75801.1 peptide-methionine (S)-S-oxide reductase [Idiomarina seosinensis]